MNIQQKLVQFPFLIGVISLTVFITSMGVVISNIAYILNVEHPRLAAAYELEININLAASEVFIIGQTHTNHKQNEALFEDAVKDFKINYQLFTDPAVEVGALKPTLVEFDALVTEFIDLGRSIFKYNSEMITLLNQLHGLLDEHIDSLLDEGLQKNIDTQSVKQQRASQEIEINLYELVSAIEGYVLKPSNALKARIADSAQDVHDWLSVYQSQSMTALQQASVDQLADDMQLIEKQTTEVVNLKDIIARDLVQFNQLYRQLDQLLDHNLQVDAQQQLDQKALEMDQLLQFMTGFMILTIGLTMFILYRFTQPIIRAIKGLNQTSSAFSETGSIKLPNTPNDEIGELAEQMEQMMMTVKDNHQKLEEAALHDSLTGLPNRSLLFDRMSYLISEFPRTQQLSAIVYLDLDNFKTVNDTLGHAAGDDLLNQVCERIEALLRKSDTLSRVGGDEFILILPDQSDPVQTQQILSRILNALSEPFEITDQTVQVTSSMGVTFLSADNQVGADELVQQADKAMYQAKHSGKNTICFFEDL